MELFFMHRRKMEVRSFFLHWMLANHRKCTDLVMVRWKDGTPSGSTVDKLVAYWLMLNLNRKDREHLNAEKASLLTGPVDF